MSRIFKKIKNTDINVLYNIEKIIKQIKKLKTKVDIIILSIHWGNEYKFNRNQNQYELSKLFVKNGVDIILGHHPHVLQDMEIINIKSNNKIKKGYVFYSLGNFLFDSHVKKKGVRDTFILKIEIDKYKKFYFSYLPCIIHPEIGYVPVPTRIEYQKVLPKKTTNDAENLYKYIECSRKTACKIYENLYKKEKKNTIYILLLFIILFIIYKLK